VSRLGRLMSNYFGNSLKEVVNFFSEKKDLDVEDLDEAMKMLEELKQQKDRKG
jgi:BlaI family penicillinase repressor